MGLSSQLFLASVSWVRGYQRERLPPGLWGPLSLLLATGAAAGGPLGPQALLWSLALEALLVAQFRLWDDLEDLPSDKKTYPKRVLSRTPTILPFRATRGALAALVVVLLLAEPARLLGYGALLAALWGWYRVRPRSAVPRALGGLLKYPAMALLGATGPWVTGGRAAAALALLGCFCAHEVLHDERLRGEGLARPALLGSVAAAGLAAAAGVALVGPPAALVVALGGSSLVGAGLWLARRWGRGPLGAGEARGVLWACWVFELVLVGALHFAGNGG